MPPPLLPSGQKNVAGCCRTFPTDKKKLKRRYGKTVVAHEFENLEGKKNSDPVVKKDPPPKKKKKERCKIPPPVSASQLSLSPVYKKNYPEAWMSDYIIFSLLTPAPLRIVSFSFPSSSPRHFFPRSLFPPSSFSRIMFSSTESSGGHSWR